MAIRMRFLLITALALGLLVSCHKPGSGVLVDPALATLVPADSVALAGVKIESIRQTAVYAKYIEPSASLRIRELADKTGFDPRKDLYELLFVSDGNRGLVFARGKFSPLGLEPKPGGDGVERMSYKGLSLMGDDKSAVAFLNPSVAVIGPTPYLKTFLDHRNDSNGIPAPLREHLASLRPESQIWAVTLGGSRLAGVLPQSGNMVNLNRILAGVKYSTWSLDLRTGLDVLARAAYNSEDGAKQTNDALRALLGFARLNIPNDRPGLLKALDNIQVIQEGPSVRLTAQLTNQLVDELAAARP